MTKIKLSEISEYLVHRGFPNTAEGSGNPPLSGVNTLEDAVPGELSFLANPKYRAKLMATRASAAIVGPDDPIPEGLAVLRCSDPYGAVAVAIRFIHGVRRHPQWGCDPRAVIAITARTGQNANIGPTW